MMRPWGIILFVRNIESRDQLRALTDDLREKSGNAHLPIILTKRRAGMGSTIICSLIRQWGHMANSSKKIRLRRLGGASRGLLAQDLFALGISINALLS